MPQYLTPDDVRDNPLALTIDRVERELIDGRPRLVLYFTNFDKGLILTRQLADDISAAYGRNAEVERFFATEGRDL